MEHLRKKCKTFIHHRYFLLILIVMHTKWTKSVPLGALPFKSIIFKASWKVLNVLNRFFKNLLKYGASSKKLKHFHISPVLCGHSNPKICSLRSHITRIFDVFSSKAPVIHDDKSACPSNSMAHSFIDWYLANDPSCLSRKGVLVHIMCIPERSKLVYIHPCYKFEVVLFLIIIDWQSPQSTTKYFIHERSNLVYLLYGMFE